MNFAQTVPQGIGGKLVLVFSDEDLKELKERFAKRKGSMLLPSEGLALLARLDASEQALIGIMALKTWTGTMNRKRVKLWETICGRTEK